MAIRRVAELCKVLAPISRARSMAFNAAHTRNGTLEPEITTLIH
jgi:hypothetical protein